LPVLLLATTLPWFAPLVAPGQDSTEPPSVNTSEGGGGAFAPQKAPQRLHTYQVARAEPSSRSGPVGVAEVNTATRYVDRLKGIVASSHTGRPGANNALIILSSSADAKNQADLQEDLAIMSHILDKAIDDNLGSEQRMRKALGVDIFFSPDAGRLRNAYIEGYGALFLLQVNFPLLAPATKAETSKEEPPVTSAWEEAREEVLGTPGQPGPGPVPVEPFSEEKVNRLKTTLLDALKNAANIRHLKPDAGVTICVFGGSRLNAGRVARSASFNGRGDLLLLQELGTPQRATMLTLRADKSDIDAIAKGQMDADDFRQKVATATYEADTGTRGFSGGMGGFGYGAGNFGGYGGGGSASSSRDAARP